MNRFIDSRLTFDESVHLNGKTVVIQQIVITSDIGTVFFNKST